MKRELEKCSDLVHKSSCLPVQMESCNLCVVSLEVGKIEMIWQSLLFSGEPVKILNFYYFVYSEVSFSEIKKISTKQMIQPRQEETNVHLTRLSLECIQQIRNEIYFHILDCPIRLLPRLDAVHLQSTFRFLAPQLANSTTILSKLSIAKCNQTFCGFNIFLCRELNLVIAFSPMSKAKVLNIVSFVHRFFHNFHKDESFTQFFM